MGLKLKVCVSCGKQKLIGKSKKRCKSCRNTLPIVKVKICIKPKLNKEESYLDRDIILLQLGFSSYKDYLLSDLWSFIRRKGFGINGSKCKLCCNNANVLHHLSYKREILLGDRIDMLVPLCNNCHDIIEFTKDRYKRSIKEANEMYNYLCKRI